MIRPTRVVPAAVVLLAALASTSYGKSPRTGDLALTFAVGANRAVNDDSFHSAGIASLALEMHWSAASSVRGTIGSLDLPSRDSTGRGQVSALYVTGNVSHNWLRRAVIPYVTGGVGLYAVEERTGPGSDRDWLSVGLNGGAGLEFRLADAATLRLEGAVHAMTGDGPSTIATGTLGIKFYF